MTDIPLVLSFFKSYRRVDDDDDDDDGHDDHDDDDQDDDASGIDTDTDQIDYIWQKIDDRRGIKEVLISIAVSMVRLRRRVYIPTINYCCSNNRLRITSIHACIHA